MRVGFSFNDIEDYARRGQPLRSKNSLWGFVATRVNVVGAGDKRHLSIHGACYTGLAAWGTEHPSLIPYFTPLTVQELKLAKRAGKSIILVGDRGEGEYWAGLEPSDVPAPDSCYTTARVCYLGSWWFVILAPPENSGWWFEKSMIRWRSRQDDNRTRCVDLSTSFSCAQSKEPQPQPQPHDISAGPCGKQPQFNPGEPPGTFQGVVVEHPEPREHLLCGIAVADAAAAAAKAPEPRVGRCPRCGLHACMHPRR